MAKKLKEYYDYKYLVYLSDKIMAVSSDFDKIMFLEHTKDKIENLEFAGRQDLIARALYQSINLSYEDTLLVFYQILGPELLGNSGAFSEGWWLWPIGKYVEIYGVRYFDESTAFSKELTKRFTGEYCMRPVIINYPVRSIELLKEWSLDENERVRRLSSECLRIRLPWAKKMYVALDYFDDYFEILDNLKTDPDKYIQKSVANNLNDLYKEDKDKFYFVINSWEKEDISKETAWIIKHGSRTLLKEKNENRN